MYFSYAWMGKLVVGLLVCLEEYLFSKEADF